MSGQLQHRRQTLRQLLAERGIDVLIVTSPENRRYLTGFTGSAGWFLIGRSAEVVPDLLLTDFRYVEQAGMQTDVTVQRCGRYPEQDVVAALGAQQLTIGFEADTVVYSVYERLHSTLSAHKLVPVTDVVETVRMVKDEQELAAITRAAEVADLAIGRVRAFARSGVSERELAAELKRVLADAGSDGESFPTIAASGPRSALAHGFPSERQLGAGDLLVVDLGAVINGYRSDITRAFVVGEPDQKQIQIHRHVVEAMDTAMAHINPGVIGKEVDKAARDYLDERGWGDYFGHSLGHGVGLSSGEGPRLAEGSDDCLAADMVVTVEPGVYIPGWGGIRVEDLVHITDDSPQVLTRSPRELIVIG